MNDTVLNFAGQNILFMWSHLDGLYQGINRLFGTPENLAASLVTVVVLTCSSAQKDNFPV